jgi:hypothetical protein
VPLQKLQFRPGVNREGTSLSNEGGWYDCDKVRFRSGYPEKIGGWAALSYNTFLGTCRSLFNWVTLNGANLLGVGTNLKFYVEDGGAYYDITPLREINGNTPSAGPPVINASTITLAITNGSSVLTITDTAASTLQVNDFVTLAGAVALGTAGTNVTAAVLNQEYQIVSVISGTQYTVALRNAVSGNITTTNGGAPLVSNRTASSSVMSGLTVAYQISTGFDTATVGTGWGTGPWSRGVWGSSFTTGFSLQLRLWNQSNFGEELLFSPRGGALYIWQPGGGSTPAFGTRGTAITGTDVPSKINQIMVSDSARIVICFGCNDYGAYNTTPLDPLLIRWSEQESFTGWTPAITNQAGSYRLSRGSEIIGAIQTRQEIVVWTDAAVYAMQYLGPPFVWGFTLLADNISIVSPNAVATAAGVVYWMGVDKFYIYAGRVETLPCSVRQFVFNDINRDQEAQFFAGTNEGFSEIWWYYCSKNSTVVDRYVIFNYLDRVWYYGTLNRTAWLDSPLRQFPQAATNNNLIVFHEAAVDNGETNPPSAINSYIQSSDFDIDDGHNYGFVWRMLPDITFDGSDTTGVTTNKPFVTFTVRPRQNPGSGYGVSTSPSVTSAQSYAGQTSYNVQQFTEIIYSRVRGRQMAFKVESNSAGTQWQLGVPKIDVRPDGRN